MATEWLRRHALATLGTGTLTVVCLLVVPATLGGDVLSGAYLQRGRAQYRATALVGTLAVALLSSVLFLLCRVELLAPAGWLSDD